MKKILDYLKQYLKIELKPWFLVSIMVFIAFYIFNEYYNHFSEHFEVAYHDTWLTLNWIFLTIKIPTVLLIQFLTYFIPFVAAYLLYSIFYKDWKIWKSPLFWLLLIGAPFIFSCRSYINYMSDTIYSFLPTGRTAYFYYRCTAVILRDLVIVIPIFVYWRIMDKKEMPFYGFTLKNYNTKPYLVLLAIMVPLVVLASYQSDFLHQYPKGFSLEPLSMNNEADQKYFFIYELFYGFDFIFIEFFFRGFLLLAFYRHFGWGCLLPMACFYVSIHFGKPLGETISSFFGGSILGILAIRTGSIAGGIIVHLGVAWLMEFTALLHKIL